MLKRERNRRGKNVHQALTVDPSLAMRMKISPGWPLDRARP